MKFLVKFLTTGFLARALTGMGREGRVQPLGRAVGVHRTVTRGPERQGRRGEEKVRDAAAVHGRASPADGTAGENRRPRVLPCASPWPSP